MLLPKGFKVNYSVNLQQISGIFNFVHVVLPGAIKLPFEIRQMGAVEHDTSSVASTRPHSGSGVKQVLSRRQSARPSTPQDRARLASGADK
jgi:hypothetical protein